MELLDTSDLTVLFMGEDFLECVFACSCEYGYGIAFGHASGGFFFWLEVFLCCRTRGVDLEESAAIAFDSDWDFRWLRVMRHSHHVSKILRARATRSRNPPCTGWQRHSRGEA